jgi:hypothetical protein
MPNKSKGFSERKQEGNSLSYELRQYGPEIELCIEKSANGVKYDVYERHLPDMTLGRMPLPTLEINMTFSDSGNGGEVRIETSGVLSDYGMTEPYSIKSRYGGDSATKIKEEYLNSGAERFFLSATKRLMNVLSCEVNDTITLNGFELKDNMRNLGALAKIGYLNGEAERFIERLDKGLDKAKRE